MQLAAALIIAVVSQSPSTCRISTQDVDGASSLGTGCLIGKDDQFGLVVTADHVIRDAGPSVFVRFPHLSKNGHYPAKVLQRDQRADVASLLIVTPSGATPAPVSRDNPSPGIPVWQEGFGGGPFRRLSGAIKPYRWGGAGGLTLLNWSIPSRSGDSGGPVYDEQGQLCGITSCSDKASESFGATPGQIRSVVPVQFRRLYQQPGST